MRQHPTIPGYAAVKYNGPEIAMLRRQSGGVAPVCTWCPHFVAHCELTAPGQSVVIGCTAGRDEVWVPVHILVAMRLEAS